MKIKTILLYTVLSLSLLVCAILGAFLSIQRLYSFFQDPSLVKGIDVLCGLFIVLGDFLLLLGERAYLKNHHTSYLRQSLIVMASGAFLHAVSEVMKVFFNVSKERIYFNRVSIVVLSIALMILAAVLFFIFNDERYQILRGRLFVLLAVTTTLLMTNAINVTYHHLINYALHISLPISLLVYTIMIILLCVLRDREY